MERKRIKINWKKTAEYYMDKYHTIRDSQETFTDVGVLFFCSFALLCLNIMVLSVI